MSIPKQYTFRRVPQLDDLPDYLHLTCENRITAPYRNQAQVVKVEELEGPHALRLLPYRVDDRQVTTAWHAASIIFRPLSEIPWLPQVFTTLQDARLAGAEGTVILKPYQLDVIEVSGKEGKEPWDDDNRLVLSVSRFLSHSPFSLYQAQEDARSLNAVTLFTTAGAEFTVSSATPIRVLEGIYRAEPDGYAYAL